MDRHVSEVFFQEEFPSTLEAMNQSLERAVAALAARGWIDVGRSSQARLCLEEALVNAIQHGNHGEAGRKVRLELTGDPVTCTIRVFDEGNGFRPEEVKMPAGDQLGGRGVCLMRHFMDHITYDRSRKCLEMVFRRGHCC